MIGLVNCRWGDVVGPTARELNYKLVARKMLMIDQATHIIPNGGAHGLGLIIGENFWNVTTGTSLATSKVNKHCWFISE